MIGRLPKSLLAAPLLAGALACGQASIAKALSFAPCPHAPGFQCTTMTVPVVRAQPQLGTITLHIERKLAGPTPSKDAVLALAGGPGQPALPLAADLASTMAPALGERDLIVFDQRGTGESGALHCSALTSSLQKLSEIVERCGQQLGPARSGYASSESVADMEAIREALGYEKLVLYGTSYGTKVALQYAAAHPTRVESMVLDSVVPQGGVEPFYIPTMKALRPVLSELCSRRACAGITADPLRDLAHLAARMRRDPLRGRVYDGAGRRHSSSMGETGLLEVLLAGDLNPALRAMMPAAVRSALRGDPAPLLRLGLLSRGLVPNRPGRPPTPNPAQEIDTPLLLDTSCEDTPFPWSRSSPPATRLTEAERALAAIPPSAFYPFDAHTAANAGLLGACAYWSYSTAAPTPAGPLPDVPTLILSGAQDLRTPTSGARALQAQIPGSQLLVVPYTGHSVLGSDFSGCAKIALEAFFEGAQVLPCGPIPDFFSPTPPTPRKLAQVRGIRGLPQRAGRTLRAVLDTMIDLDRQVIGATLQAEQKLPSGSSFGGLRGGYARITSSSLRLHRFSFVQGVTLSGTFPVRKGEVGGAAVHVGGFAAARGSVRIGAGSNISGVLGGRHFKLGAKSASAASAGKGRRWRGIGRNLLPRGLTFPLPQLAFQL